MLEPRTIIEELKKLPPRQRDGFTQSYLGISVNWKLLFKGAQTITDNPSMLKINAWPLKHLYPDITFNINEKNYPEFNIMHEDTIFSVKGIIEKVSTDGLHLHLQIESLKFNENFNEKKADTKDKSQNKIYNIVKNKRREVDIQTSSTNKWKEWWKKSENKILFISILGLLIAFISIPWSDIFTFFNNKKIPSVDNIIITATPSLKTPIDKINLVNLRSLEPLETGKKIGELPNNVYFYASPLKVVYEIEDSKIDFLDATNKRINNYSFEIQKIDNRYYLIGFVSDETYSKIGTVNSDNSLSTIIFPNKWGGASSPIAIPFDSVYTANDRDIELDSETTIHAIDIDFKEVIDQPQTHTN
jgi:hypothetical protein